MTPPSKYSFQGGCLQSSEIQDGYSFSCLGKATCASEMIDSSFSTSDLQWSFLQDTTGLQGEQLQITKAITFF